jgi:hypothetical protein
VTDISGWFEPVQGVWQDDYTFADKPGKQLTEKKGTETPLYEAELKMVQGRDTLLFGIRGSSDPDNDPKRFVIQLAGNTTGTIPVSVHFEFFLNGNRIYQDSQQFEILLDAAQGECGEQITPFEANLSVANGIPPSGTFTINTPAYVLDS